MEQPGRPPRRVPVPPLARFAERLRELRRDCGGPSIRDLVGLMRKGGEPFARSTISDKLGGVSPPSWEFVRAFVRACDRHAGRPGPAGLEYWRRSYQELMRELADAAPLPAVAAAHPGPPPPRQLPPDVAGFTGRTAALAALGDVLASVGDGRPGAVVLVSGPAGVGKTTAAVHWGHAVASQFRDGQLYLNLRGFGPSARPMSPVHAVRLLLEGLAVLPERIPRSLDGRSALLRSLLAGRRVLIVLDNAGDAEQVRPLLAGGPGCLTVVTSRDQLTDLAAAGAAQIPLGVFSAREAHDLMVARLGAARVNAEATAAAEIAVHCARLPLALAMVAARAGLHPAFRLSDLAGELRGASGALDVLAGGGMGVRAVFSWSYRTLSSGAATLFRLMGLQPGPEISLAAVASLAGLPMPQLRARLAELTQAHLIDEVAPARYGFHDLLRAYAVELAVAADSAADRGHATQRVLGHYLCTAIGAARLINPRWDPAGVPPSTPGVTPETFVTDRDALAWFSAELPVLLAAIRLADAGGYDTYVWQLAGAVLDFLCMRREPQALAITSRAALRAATCTSNLAGQAQAHRGLAIAAAMLVDYGASDRHLRQAAGLYAELGDRGGQARCYLNLGTLYERRKDYPQALEFARRGLDLLAAQPETRKARGHALCNIGRLLVHLGDTTQALTSCARALELMQDLGDRFGLANAADNLGFVYHRLGEHGRAAACYRTALGLYRELGARDGEAGVLGRLGDHHEALGDSEAAVQLWRAAMAIFDELDDSDGADIRARLAGAAAPREIAL